MRIGDKGDDERGGMLRANPNRCGGGGGLTRNRESWLRGKEREKMLKERVPSLC